MSGETLSEIKHQDLVNNNHIGLLEEKTKALELRDDMMSDDDDAFLFSPSLLFDIKSDLFQFKYDKFEAKSKFCIQVSFQFIGLNWFVTESCIDLGDGLVLRPLKRGDFDRHYMALLEQLTEVGEVSREQFRARFDKMRSAANTYYIFVVEDEAKSKLAASITLVYEQKFIRRASSRGRVEDLVVDVDYRGKKLSKLLLDLVCQFAKALGCYKISLECKDHLRKHYEQFGFVLEPGQTYLCRRY